MKKKINFPKKISLNKEKLNALTESQLNDMLGGRMALTTFYTSGPGNCSNSQSACCSHGASACCA